MDLLKKFVYVFAFLQTIKQHTHIENIITAKIKNKIIIPNIEVDFACCLLFTKSTIELRMLIRA